VSIYFIVIYVILGIYVVLNFKYDLQMFQQNSYRLPRYWRWLRSDVGSTWRLVDVASLFLVMAVLLDYRLSALVAALVALSKIFLILRRKSKKPLVFTHRVWRLYAVTALIAVGTIVGLACGLGTDQLWGYYPGQSMVIIAALMLSIFSYVPVMIADIFLMPVEYLIRQHYINDAKRILRSMPDLKVIGITGSYGKTSTKHYLASILSMEFDTLITPGSFNTPMGVVRTIREQLKPYNQIFICEMGAKQIGDIKEICDIVHPKEGIITAVGPMHLETFKSIDNVCRTKFELADALPADGLAVVNDDSEPCATRTVNNVRTLRYGVKNHMGCDYIARDVHYTPAGTTFTVQGPEGLEFEVQTRLLGEGNISDLLAAIVIALQNGMTPQKIRTAVAGIQPVEHRLSIRQIPGNITVIDDAFNSNPSGARMAVDVLADFKQGKRIIITPGMVELGSSQYDLNREFGKYIGSDNHVDVIILVGATNRDALKQGVNESDFDTENLIVVDNFNEAQKRLQPLLTPGATVLYENDLPDSFK
jgi:UDP-N-acetylmuramoyl-tripeptide--D-alanyl-D-alanine ligase